MGLLDLSIATISVASTAELSWVAARSPYLRNRIVDLPPAKLRALWWPEIAERVAKSRLSPIPRAAANWLKDEMFDAAAARISATLRSGVFHAWPGHGLRTFRLMKKTGARLVVEQGAAYARTRVQDVQAESASLGLPHADDLDNGNLLDKYDQELSLADRILCPSSYVKGTLEAAGVPTDKIRVTPFGCPPPTRKRDLQVVLYIVFVGPLGVAKGFHLFLQAAAEMSSRWPQFSFVAVGRHTAHTEALRRMFPAPVRVIHHLDHGSLQDLYSRARLFVLPSLSEGQSLAMMEALSAGVPCVVTSRCGLPEDIARSGAARVTDTASVSELVDAADELLGHPLEVQASAAQMAANEYTWSRYVNGVCNAYG